jgi:hypothetical protein
MDISHPEIGKFIKETNTISPEAEKALKQAVEEFKKSFCG